MNGLKPDELKRVGIVAQRQKDFFLIRLKTVGGDLGADELNAVSSVSRRFADSRVHLTTRQAVEIHNVHKDNIEEAAEELKAGGLVLGTCGPRTRGIVACPGNSTCTSGLVDTKGFAAELDALLFRREAPHKFKVGVSGCPNNCSKPIENDAGLMGGVLPVRHGEECVDCGLCISICPAGAIKRTIGGYELEQDNCILCGLCIGSCPASAWEPLKTGYVLYLGGTLGKKPRLGTRATGLIGSREELLGLTERAFEFFQRNGRTKERFGHTLDRLGLDASLREILGGGCEVVDLRGVCCPANFARAKVALESVEAGQRLEFYLDEGEPMVNVTRSLKDDGHRVLNVSPEDVYFRVLVQKD